MRLVFPLEASGEALVGSTDVGDVSWAVPTVQMRGATYAVGTPGHSWQLVAQGKAPLAHKGMATPPRRWPPPPSALFADPALVADAKADFARRREGRPFVNPIPDDIEPELPASAAFTS